MMSPEMCRKTPEVFKGLRNMLNQQESVPQFKRNNYIRESDQELVTTMKSIKKPESRPGAGDQTLTLIFDSSEEVQQPNL